jgi:hypothetical protein
MTRRIAIDRRAAAAGIAAAFAHPFVVRAQAAKTAKLSVGRQPFAAGNSPVTQYMMANKLFEKAAAAAGFDLTVDWRDYPSAIPWSRPSCRATSISASGATRRSCA